MEKEQLRTFDSPGEFFILFNKTFKGMRTLHKIPQDQKISPQLREKLMVAVSTVNKCAYCSYLHTQTALEQGISRNEIDNIIRNDTSQISEEDLPAILFAQHFSETKGLVSEKALGNVENIFGTSMTTQIQFFLQSVLFGNLCCNTYTSFRKKLLTRNEKKHLRAVYYLSYPIARMIPEFV